MRIYVTNASHPFGTGRNPEQELAGQYSYKLLAWVRSLIVGRSRFVGAQITINDHEISFKPPSFYLYGCYCPWLPIPNITYSTISPGRFLTG
jgi:hypothetical protein